MTAAGTPDPVGRHPADRYVGIPFVELGCSHDGVSCWGLVQLYFREQMDITLPDYPLLPDQRLEISREIRAAQNSGDWEMVAYPKTGDVAILAHRLNPFHIGVYVDGWILHATQLKPCAVVAERVPQLLQRGFGRIQYARYRRG